MRAKHQSANQSNMYTFTDLAQMICQVSRCNRYYDTDDSSSDEIEEYEADLEDAQEIGYASEPTVGISDQVFDVSCHNINSIPSLNHINKYVWILKNC